MITNLSMLSAELKTDPLAIGYAKMSASTIADSLNGLTRSGPVAIELGTLMGALMRMNVWPVIRFLASGSPNNTSPHDQAWGAAVTVVDLVTNTVGVSEIDIADLPAFGAAVDALAAQTTISADQATALKALGVGAISRATELGLGGSPDVNDVVNARNSA